MDERIRSALEHGQTIDITTTGRKSGLPRRIELSFENLGGRLYLCGEPGPRDWLANLQVNPEFMFHLKESGALCSLILSGRRVWKGETFDL